MLLHICSQKFVVGFHLLLGKLILTAYTAARLGWDFGVFLSKEINSDGFSCKSQLRWLLNFTKMKKLGLIKLFERFPMVFMFSLSTQ